MAEYGNSLQRHKRALYENLLLFFPVQEDLEGNNCFICNCNIPHLQALMYTILGGTRAGQHWKQGWMGPLFSLLTGSRSECKNSSKEEKAKDSRLTFFEERVQECRVWELLNLDTIYPERTSN